MGGAAGGNLGRPERLGPRPPADSGCDMYHCTYHMAMEDLMRPRVARTRHP